MQCVVSNMKCVLLIKKINICNYYCFKLLENKNICLYRIEGTKCKQQISIDRKT